METFQNGRNEIELNNIANYWPSLNKMLDKWALHILERLRFEEDVSISEIIKYAEEPIHKIYPISDLCNYSKN